MTTEVKILKSYFWYEESPRPRTANFIFIKELFGKFFLIINFQNIWKCSIDTVLHLLIFVCKIYFRNKQQHKKFTEIWTWLVMWSRLLCPFPYESLRPLPSCFREGPPVLLWHKQTTPALHWGGSPAHYIGTIVNFKIWNDNTVDYLFYERT